MKKAYSFRLSEATILAIRVRQKERGLRSEAAAIEDAFAGASYNGITPGFEPEKAGSIPAAPAKVEEVKWESGLTKIAPKGSFTLEQLRGMISGGRNEVPLLETPRAPFDLNIEGEPHRVTTSGKRLALFYMGSEEPVLTRYLADGELEKLWEKRIIK